MALRSLVRVFFFAASVLWALKSAGMQLCMHACLCMHTYTRAHTHLHLHIGFMYECIHT